MLRKALLLISLGAVLSSCHVQQCKQCGTIEVSAPQVFTRERLIEDRWREVQWLNQKLAMPFEPTLQGLAEERLVSQLFLTLKGDVSPLKIQGTGSKQGGETRDSNDSKIEATSGPQKTPPTIQLTALERIADEKAFRDGIAALLREKQLNDTHDLRGNTLYELKFDLSLLPSEGANQYGVVKLKIVKPQGLDCDWSEQQCKDTLKKWLRLSYDEFLEALGREVAKEAIWLQSRLDHLSDETWATIQASLKSQERDLGECLKTTSNHHQRKQLACYVRDKYLKHFGNLASIHDPMPIDVNGEQFYFSHVTKLPDEIVLKDFRIVAQANESVRVATVEPKEYAQNISEIASRENLRNLALSLAATLPNGISPSTYIQSIDRSQELAQSILRRPLLIAFNNRAEFGWLLGPKFSIKNALAEFSHSPVRHSVTATIEVPGWYPLVCLEGEVYWLDRQNEPSQPLPLWKDEGKEPCKEGQLRVELVPDFSSLILSIMNDPRDRSFVKPRIDMDSKRHLSATLHPVSKASQFAALIHGRNLWRNPAVFIGSAKATYVEILPNMEGLVGYFSDADIQREAQYANGSANLTVVTTFGVDVVPITLPPKPHP